jgi:hypothetical protein
LFSLFFFSKGFGFVLRCLLYNVLAYMFVIGSGYKLKYKSAVLASFLIGSAVPVCLNALTIIWDYQSLKFVSILFELLLLMSRSISLNAVLDRNSLCNHVDF